MVGGDREGVAGVVVEPGEDFGVGAVGEAVVGDVCLPGFVGLVGLEADVGGFRFFVRCGLDEVVATQDPVDRGPRQCDAVVVFEVPADCVGAGIEALGGELAAKLDDEIDRRCWCCVRSGTGSS